VARTAPSPAQSSAPAKPARSSSNANHPLGNWTLLGTWLALGLVGWLGHGFGPLWTAMQQLLTGHGAEIVRTIPPVTGLAALAGAFCAVSLPLALAVAQLIKLWLGEARNVNSNAFSSLMEKNQFRAIFITVLGEEIYARWLFLGLLTQVWHGSIGFYVLALIGNTSWALLHMANNPDKTQRHWGRVLPQFTTGILLTGVYVGYGFMAVLLVHFAFDAMVFAGQKRQSWNVVNLAIVGYELALAGLSALVLFAWTDTPVGEITKWFSTNPTFALPGWTFTSYLAAVVLGTSLVSVGLELLAYDHGNRDDELADTSMFDKFFGSMILVGGELGVFALLGLFMTSVPHRVIVIGLLLMMLVSKTASGSAMSRTFWGLPSSYLVLCTFVALGFWGAVAVTLVIFATSAPTTALVRATARS
jgi:hypothetical protein